MGRALAPLLKHLGYVQKYLRRHMQEPTYRTVLCDVIRYRLLIRKGVQKDDLADSDLPPAAEEALRYLTSRVADELSIPEWMARLGLLYAANQYRHPARMTFVTLAVRLRTVESPPI